MIDPITQYILNEGWFNKKKPTDEYYDIELKNQKIYIIQGWEFLEDDDEDDYPNMKTKIIIPTKGIAESFNKNKPREYKQIRYVDLNAWYTRSSSVSFDYIFEGGVEFKTINQQMKDVSVGYNKWVEKITLKEKVSADVITKMGIWNNSTWVSPNGYILRNVRGSKILKPEVTFRVAQGYDDYLELESPTYNYKKSLIPKGRAK